MIYCDRLLHNPTVEVKGTVHQDFEIQALWTHLQTSGISGEESEASLQNGIAAFP